jgi:hypothetical protein
MSQFRVGQMVVLGGAAKAGAPEGRSYKVLSAVTLPDGTSCYRIKSIAEASDRIVPEDAIEPGPPSFRVIDRPRFPFRQDLGSGPKPGGPLR